MKDIQKEKETRAILRSSGNIPKGTPERRAPSGRKVIIIHLYLRNFLIDTIS